MKGIVLLIDDTLTLLKEIEDILIMEDYEVHTATDGFVGLSKISTLQPDIIITDLVMPEMSGFSLIEKIRSLSKYDHIPIIVMSAQNSPEDKQKANELRADRYLTKPCDADNLLSTIEEVLQKK